MKKGIVVYIVLGMVIGGGLMGLGGWLTKTLANNGSSVLERVVQVSSEESVVTKVVEKATPSVVTVSISKVNKVFDPFAGFDFFGGFESSVTEEKVEKDIGTGFIISADGLIVTNKHVVSDTSAKYRVIIGKDEMSDVVQIYRDPENDLAILKINKSGLTPVELGDSDKIKVGQTVIAIGTALGEFRSTVTTGVISGLGRGIVAGSPLQGSEKLDNVIQTDAAINPGNSGGPLFNSSGEVIGVNVAVSQNGQGIGFALPINMVKESINNFKTTGEFDRPYLGVGYQIISKQAALLNEVPAGAYVKQVGDDSPAAKAGVKVGDIIVDIDGNKIEGEFSIAGYINKKKIGDTVRLKVFRDNADLTLEVRLEKRG